MALLEVRDLALEYSTERGPLRAVDGISFDLRGGEALGIIGESGSGKTSLAIALMRLLPRNATLIGGTMRLGGDDIGALSDEDFRTQVRWSRHGHGLPGRDALAQPRHPRRRPGRRAAARRRDGQGRGEGARRRSCWRRVGLPPATAERYPHELSGGMKQRVMIATALTHDPPLLILDEPTSALDVSIQAQIMNLLKELKAERRIAMLFITHDLALASDLCDRIAVVYAGQMRELGSAEDVLGRPADPYTQRLLASIPSLHDATPPDFLPGAPPDLRDDIAGCRFAARCPLVFEPCSEAPPLPARSAPGHWRALLAARPGDAAAAGAGP